eukprot:TRINITY_DN323_c1_g3_i1.p1 TRINITY_DN323_c1_g3~~TRINITY_DN323_c1_g3_i1.p1  ORF type:complete len:333 (+),score=188.91 TRINITY_DN323_c1_g3_i1:106-1104(+)
MALEGSNNQEKFANLCNKTHKDQLIWFLNCYWEDIEADKENFWLYAEKCKELDLENHENGNGLDELNAHRFLEAFDETMTVRELRNSLKQSGAVAQNHRFKTVPISHILLFKYKKDFNELVTRSQGDNKEEMEQAKAQLEEVQALFQEARERAEEAAALLKVALEREENARQLEAPFKAAQEELEAALADVKKQEDEYNGKIEDCKRRSEEGGVVTRNKAKNELAQLLAEDPLPLRKAKITLEAAKKKAEKARAPFKAATEEAEAARKASEDAKHAAEAAVDAAADKVAEAEAFLNEVKNKPGQPMGALYWVERELHEAKKYLPESKGGIRK